MFRFLSRPIPVALAMAAIRDRDVLGHRAWMMRAYAIGMALGVVALVFFPIHIATGRPPTGLASDILFVTSWVLSIARAEVMLPSSSRSARRGTA